MPKQITKAEVRKDNIHDRFVIIAPKRHERPHDLIEQPEKPVSSLDCPFCHKDILKSTPLFLVRDKGKAKKKHSWLVRVIRNKYPAINTDNPKAYGYQEVILETPEHNKELADLPINHIIKVLESFRERTKKLSQDKKIKYILIFKNQGGKAGASLVHAHSQIFAASFLPPHIIDKLTKAQKYRIANGICYYCELLKKEEKGSRHIVSDNNFVVFTPYASIYGYEAWLMPRRHMDNITQLDTKELKSLAKFLKYILTKLNSEQISYNFFLHQAITDKDEHFYIRICPRKEIWAGIEMGSRLIINPVSPEEAAEFYRS